LRGASSHFHRNRWKIHGWQVGRILVLSQHWHSEDLKVIKRSAWALRLILWGLSFLRAKGVIFVELMPHVILVFLDFIIFNNLRFLQLVSLILVISLIPKKETHKALVLLLILRYFLLFIVLIHYWWLLLLLLLRHGLSLLGGLVLGLRHLRWLFLRVLYTHLVKGLLHSWRPTLWWSLVLVLVYQTVLLDFLLERSLILVAFLFTLEDIE
jgi:hypothetical protein